MSSVKQVWLVCNKLLVKVTAEDRFVLKGSSCVSLYFPGFSEQYTWEETRAAPEQHLRTSYQQRTKLWHLVEEAALCLELRQLTWLVGLAVYIWFFWTVHNLVWFLCVLFPTAPLGRLVLDQVLPRREKKTTLRARDLIWSRELVKLLSEGEHVIPVLMALDSAGPYASIWEDWTWRCVAFTGDSSPGRCRG